MNSFVVLFQSLHIIGAMTTGSPSPCYSSSSSLRVRLIAVSLWTASLLLWASNVDATAEPLVCEAGSSGSSCVQRWFDAGHFTTPCTEFAVRVFPSTIEPSAPLIGVGVYAADSDLWKVVVHSGHASDSRSSPSSAAASGGATSSSSVVGVDVILLFEGFRSRFYSFENGSMVSDAATFPVGKPAFSLWERTADVAALRASCVLRLNCNASFVRMWPGAPAVLQAMVERDTTPTTTPDAGAGRQADHLIGAGYYAASSPLHLALWHSLNGAIESPSASRSEMLVVPMSENRGAVGFPCAASGGILSTCAADGAIKGSAGGGVAAFAIVAPRLAGTFVMGRRTASGLSSSTWVPVQVTLVDRRVATALSTKSASNLVGCSTYLADTDLSLAVFHSAGGLKGYNFGANVTVWVRHVGEKNFFISCTQRGVTSKAAAVTATAPARRNAIELWLPPVAATPVSVPPPFTLPIGEFASDPDDDDFMIRSSPNVSAISVFVDSLVSPDGVTGAGIYALLSSDAALAAFHDGNLVKIGQRRQLLAHFLGDATTFYSVDFMGVLSTGVAASSTVVQPAFRLRPLRMDPAERSLLLSVDPVAVSVQYIGPHHFARYVDGLTGAGVYRGRPEVTVAAYHAGVIQQEGIITRCYVHRTQRNVFYSATVSGIKSVFVTLPPYTTPMVEAIVPLTSSARPAWLANTSVTRAYVAGTLPTDWGFGVAGTYYYDGRSDVSLAAMHAGYVSLGTSRGKYVYIHHTDFGLTMRSTSNGVLSVTPNGVANTFAFSADYPPPRAISPALSPLGGKGCLSVNLTAPLSSESFLISGTGRYVWYSDITAAALHEGLVRPGETAAIAVFPLPVMQGFLASTNGPYATAAYEWTEVAFAVALHDASLEVDCERFRPRWTNDGQMVKDNIFAVRLRSVHPVFSPPTRYILGSVFYTLQPCDATLAARHAGMIPAFSDEYTTVYVRAYVVTAAQGVLPLYRLHNNTIQSGSDLLGPGRVYFAFSSTPDGTSFPNVSDYINGRHPMTVRWTANPVAAIIGTTQYSLQTELSGAAAHMGLVNFLEWRNIFVWFRQRTPRVRLFGSTNNDIASLSDEAAENVIVVHTDPSFDAFNPSWDVALPVTLRFGLRVGRCYGSGVYHPTSDLTAAAYHAGLLMLNESRTVYVRLVGYRSLGLLSSVSRGLLCSRIDAGLQPVMVMLKGSSEEEFSPYAKLSNRTQPMMGLVARISVMRAGFPPIYGTTFYDVSTEVDMALIHSGRLRFGEKVRQPLYAHITGIYPGLVSGVGAYGLESRSTWYNTYQPGFTAYTFSNSSDPPEWNTPIYVDLDPFIARHYLRKSRELNGFQFYSSRSEVYAVATHMMLMKRGSPTYSLDRLTDRGHLRAFVVYTGTRTVVSASVDLVRSLLAWTVPTYTLATHRFNGSLDMKPPAAPSVPGQPTVIDPVTLVEGSEPVYPSLLGCAWMTLRSFQFPNSQSVLGVGYYMDITDVAIAAIVEGIVVHTNQYYAICAYQRRPQARFLRSFVSAASENNAVRMTFSVHLMTAAVESDTPIDIIPVRVAPFSIDGDVYGTVFYDGGSTPVELAAMHCGLVAFRPANPRRLFAKILPVSPSYLYGSTNHGISSRPTTGDRFVFVLLENMTDRVPPVDGSVPLEFVYNSSVSRQMNGNVPVIGTGYYRVDSDLAMAAWHAGLITAANVRQTLQLFVHTVPGTNNGFLASTSNGISSRSAGPGRAFFISLQRSLPSGCPIGTDGVVIFSCVGDLTRTATIFGVDESVVPTIHAMENEVSAAAIFSGLVELGQRRAMKVIAVHFASANRRSVFPAGPQNGVTSVTTRDVEWAYQLEPADAACAAPLMGLPADTLSLTVTVENATNCSGRCLPAVFGTNNPAAGTFAIVSVVCVASGDIAGTGYYPLDSNMHTVCVHAGMITTASWATASLPIVTMRVTVLGARTRFLSSNSHGVGSGTSATEAVAVAVTAPNVAPPPYIFSVASSSSSTWTMPVTLDFIPRSADAYVWGTGFYSARTLVHQAAFHSGYLDVIRPGADRILFMVEISQLASAASAAQPLPLRLPRMYRSGLSSNVETVSESGIYCVVQLNNTMVDSGSAWVSPPESCLLSPSQGVVGAAGVDVIPVRFMWEASWTFSGPLTTEFATISADANVPLRLVLGNVLISQTTTDSERNRFSLPSYLHISRTMTSSLSPCFVGDIRGTVSTIADDSIVVASSSSMTPDFAAFTVPDDPSCLWYHFKNADLQVSNDLSSSVEGVPSAFSKRSNVDAALRMSGLMDITGTNAATSTDIRVWVCAVGTRRSLPRWSTGGIVSYYTGLEMLPTIALIVDDGRRPFSQIAQPLVAEQRSLALTNGTRLWFYDDLQPDLIGADVIGTTVYGTQSDAFAALYHAGLLRYDSAPDAQVVLANGATISARGLASVLGPASTTAMSLLTSESSFYMTIPPSAFADCGVYLRTLSVNLDILSYSSAASAGFALSAAPDALFQGHSLATLCGVIIDRYDPPLNAFFWLPIRVTHSPDHETRLILETYGTTCYATFSDVGLMFKHSLNHSAARGLSVATSQLVSEWYWVAVVPFFASLPGSTRHGVSTAYVFASYQDSLCVMPFTSVPSMLTVAPDDRPTWSYTDTGFSGQIVFDLSMDGMHPFSFLPCRGSVIHPINSDASAAAFLGGFADFDVMVSPKRLFLQLLRSNTSAPVCGQSPVSVRVSFASQEVGDNSLHCFTLHETPDEIRMVSPTIGGVALRTFLPDRYDVFLGSCWGTSAYAMSSLLGISALHARGDFLYPLGGDQRGPVNVMFVTSPVEGSFFFSAGVSGSAVCAARAYFFAVFAFAIGNTVTPPQRARVATVSVTALAYTQVSGHYPRLVGTTIYSISSSLSEVALHMGCASRPFETAKLRVRTHGASDDYIPLLPNSFQWISSLPGSGVAMLVECDDAKVTVVQRTTMGDDDVVSPPTTTAPMSHTFNGVPSTASPFPVAVLFDTMWMTRCKSPRGGFGTYRLEYPIHCAAYISGLLNAANEEVGIDDEGVASRDGGRSVTGTVLWANLTMTSSFRRPVWFTARRDGMSSLGVDCRGQTICEPLAINYVLSPSREAVSFFNWRQSSVDSPSPSPSVRYETTIVVPFSTNSPPLWGHYDEPLSVRSVPGACPFYWRREDPPDVTSMVARLGLHRLVNGEAEAAFSLESPRSRRWVFLQIVVALEQDGLLDDGGTSPPAWPSDIPPSALVGGAEVTVWLRPLGRWAGPIDGFRALSDGFTDAPTPTACLMDTWAPAAMTVGSSVSPVGFLVYHTNVSVSFAAVQSASAVPGERSLLAIVKAGPRLLIGGINYGLESRALPASDAAETSEGMVSAVAAFFVWNVRQRRSTFSCYRLGSNGTWSVPMLGSAPWIHLSTERLFGSTSTSYAAARSSATVAAMHAGILTPEVPSRSGAVLSVFTADRALTVASQLGAVELQSREWALPAGAALLSVALDDRCRFDATPSRVASASSSTSLSTSVSISDSLSTTASVPKKPTSTIGMTSTDSVTISKRPTRTTILQPTVSRPVTETRVVSGTLSIARSVSALVTPTLSMADVELDVVPAVMNGTFFGYSGRTVKPFNVSVAARYRRVEGFDVFFPTPRSQPLFSLGCDVTMFATLWPHDDVKNATSSRGLSNSVVVDLEVTVLSTFGSWPIRFQVSRREGVTSVVPADATDAFNASFLLWYNSSRGDQSMPRQQNTRFFLDHRLSDTPAVRGMRLEIALRFPRSCVIHRSKMRDVTMSIIVPLALPPPKAAEMSLQQRAVSSVSAALGAVNPAAGLATLRTMFLRARCKSGFRPNDALVAIPFVGGEDPTDREGAVNVVFSSPAVLLIASAALLLILPVRLFLLPALGLLEPTTAKRTLSHFPVADVVLAVMQTTFPFSIIAAESLFTLRELTTVDIVCSAVVAMLAMTQMVTIALATVPNYCDAVFEAREKPQTTLRRLFFAAGTWRGQPFGRARRTDDPSFLKEKEAEMDLLSSRSLRRRGDSRRGPLGRWAEPTDFNDWFGPLFNDTRPGGTWFCMLDTLVTWIVAASAGIILSSNSATKCVAAAATSLASLLVRAAVVVVLRPQLVPIDYFISILTGSAETTASAIQLAFVLGFDVDGRADVIIDTLMNVTQALLLAQQALTFLRRLVRRLQRKRAVASSSADESNNVAAVAPLLTLPTAPPAPPDLADRPSHSREECDDAKSDRYEERPPPRRPAKVLILPRADYFDHPKSTARAPPKRTIDASSSSSRTLRSYSPPPSFIDRHSSERLEWEKEVLPPPRRRAAPAPRDGDHDDDDRDCSDQQGRDGQARTLSRLWTCAPIVNPLPAGAPARGHSIISYPTESRVSDADDAEPLATTTASAKRQSLWNEIESPIRPNRPFKFNE